MPASEDARIKLDPRTIEFFEKSVIEWGESNKRNFCWRQRNLSPYEILVIEIILERTRAQTAEKVARKFLKDFPSPKHLKKANKKELQQILYTLGLYNKRAEAFLEIGEVLAVKYDGKVPRQKEALLELPYVGRYVANAILRFGFEKNSPLVDVNIARVLQRFLQLREPREKLATDELYWTAAKDITPPNTPKLFYWSLIDLGSLVCTESSPNHSECPLNSECPTSID